MIVCKICNKTLNDYQGLSHHLASKHHIDKKTYYDIYIKLSTEGICKICGKSTNFVSISVGYNKYCSSSCVHNDADVQAKYNSTMIDRYGFTHFFQDNSTQQKIKATRMKNNSYNSSFSDPKVIKKLSVIRQEKLASFEKDFDCTQYKKITDKYKSTVWYKLRLPKLKLGRDCFIENKYLSIIDNYMKIYNEQLVHVSKAEKQIVRFIKSCYNGTVIENSRSIIKPLELDIYLPELKLAIEYNGTWFHSSNSGTPKNYHLNKSKKCRNLGIRLIHIYEFEDFDMQLELLKSLIEGKDKYPKDYNKNNLLDGFEKVKSTLVPNKSYQIYTVGQLL